MAQPGDVLLTLADRPIRALIVYASKPAAVALVTTRVRQGLLQPDLFTLVHETFPTDTCECADIALPATAQREQLDIYRPCGTLDTMWNEAAIAPLGAACSSAERCRCPAARMGLTEPCCAETDEAVARGAHDRAAPVNATLDFDVLKQDGGQPLALPERWALFAEGNFPTPSGRCEFESETARQQGFGVLPALVPPRASALGDAAPAARCLLVLLTPPSRHYLNASFSSMASLRHDTCAARVWARVRTGIVVAPSIWWKKLSADGEHANAAPSDAPTDIGRGATCYGTAVEVARLAVVSRAH